jgi:predicted Zn-dependent peptidase
MMFDGYFYIASELDKVHVEPALEEIYKEMDMLCTDLVGEDELEMNRNYILGNLLNSVDGPFQAIRLIKSAILNNQDLDDIHQIIQKFTELSAEELRETARLYLKPSEYIEVIIG